MRRGQLAVLLSLLSLDGPVRLYSTTKKCGLDKIVVSAMFMDR